MEITEQAYYKDSMYSPAHDFLKIRLASGREVEAVQTDGHLKICYYESVSDIEAQELLREYRSVRYQNSPYSSDIKNISR